MPLQSIIEKARRAGAAVILLHRRK
jgi:hypothetical protein